MKKRLFVGIPVSAEIKEKLQPVLNKLKSVQADFNLVQSDNLHFTVKFLGGVEENKIEEIETKLKTIKVKPFTVSLESIGVFPNENQIKVIWVGINNQTLIDLLRNCNKLLEYIRKDEHPTEIPHLTLARVKSIKNKEPIKKILQELKNYTFGTMLIDKMVLYESTLTPSGPVYRIVKEIKLGKSFK